LYNVQQLNYVTLKKIEQLTVTTTDGLIIPEKAIIPRVE